MVGLLKYNYLKIGKQQAKLVSAQGFPKGTEHNLLLALNRFKRRFEKNSRTKTNVVHISLNFSPKEKVNENLMANIASRYLEEIGFGRQPFLVFSHSDTKHPHLHIITTNIAADGKRIETHNIGKTLSENARKKVESEFGLINAEAQGKQLYPSLPLEKAEYGISETKAIITNIVTEVMRTYQFASIGEFRAALSQYNIGMEIRKREADKIPGLIYFITDASGKQKSRAVFSSKIFSNPTYKNLLKKSQRNIPKKEPFKRNLKNLILRKINEVNAGKDWENILMESLKKEGVFMHLARNENGRTFGLSFVDNRTRCVFKASDLGKEYTHTALIKRFEGDRQIVLDLGSNKWETTSGHILSPFSTARSDGHSTQSDAFRALLEAGITELEWVIVSSPGHGDERGAIGRKYRIKKKTKRQ